jgi:hypothetical protein
VDETAAAEEVARVFSFKKAGRRVVEAWKEWADICKARREALWRVLVLVARAEDEVSCGGLRVLREGLTGFKVA